MLKNRAIDTQKLPRESVDKLDAWAKKAQVDLGKIGWDFSIHINQSISIVLIEALFNAALNRASDGLSIFLCLTHYEESENQFPQDMRLIPDAIWNIVKGVIESAANS